MNCVFQCEVTGALPPGSPIMCGASVCDLETSIMRRGGGAWAQVGLLHHRERSRKFTNVENFLLPNIALYISCAGSSLKLAL